MVERIDEMEATVDRTNDIIVCHDHDRWLSRADPTVRHRLTGNAISLGKYHPGEFFSSG